MTLYRVHMVLARNDEFPEGSSRHGYDFVVPLDEQGRLDPASWKSHAKDCVVRRFWVGEEDQRGRLRHAGTNWFIDYDETVVGDEEPFFKLDRHAVKTGEYLSVNERDGEAHTFRIVSVEPYVKA
ncbi:MAG TPA: hypothetical protein PKA57_01125 [Parvibaculum sp.]|uniref:hypothetical protein n=1 Tax=Parvibaculum sp. TaxID=2024848 RepID=UPI002BAA7AA8|nr:hypothetical protein [Parvibaculum sp.]HMM13199.1 hypothetical protein [Parvibaculum sp.]